MPWSAAPERRRPVRRYARADDAQGGGAALRVVPRQRRLLARHQVLETGELVLPISQGATSHTTGIAPALLPLKRHALLS